MTCYRGWLNVASCFSDVALVWEPSFVVMCHGRLRHYLTEQDNDCGCDAVVRLDSGRDTFVSHWGYESLENLHQTVHFPGRGLSQFRNSRLLSSSGDLLERTTTPFSKFKGIFQKRILSRSQSSSKLNGSSRSRSSTLPSSLSQTDAPLAQLQLHQSVFSPVHASAMPGNCFKVDTMADSYGYSCTSARERFEWLRAAGEERLVVNNIKLGVIEAQRLPSKFSYTCDVVLDGRLHARTTSQHVDRNKGGEAENTLFWAQDFEFTPLPDVKVITVELYAEARSGKKSRRRVGEVTIETGDVSGRQQQENWYPVRLDSGRSRWKGCQLRLKTAYQQTPLLHMDRPGVQSLLRYVKDSGVELATLLETALPLRLKQEFATGMVATLVALDAVQPFLVSLILNELDKTENYALVFRGNSITTKSMEFYLKLLGETYLQRALAGFVATVIDSEDINCEVDPTRLPPGVDLVANQQRLLMLCEQAWGAVLHSSRYLPHAIREVYCGVRLNCPSLANHVIGGSLFLRYLCPAILSPSLFGLSTRYPPPIAARTLTLVAKTLQTLANSARFGAKEPYMGFMNEFLEREAESMQLLLEDIAADCPRATLTPQPLTDVQLCSSQLAIVLADCVAELPANQLTTLRHTLAEARVNAGSPTEMTTSPYDNFQPAPPTSYHSRQAATLRSPAVHPKPARFFPAPQQAPLYKSMDEALRSQISPTLQSSAGELVVTAAGISTATNASQHSGSSQSRPARPLSGAATLPHKSRQFVAAGSPAAPPGRGSSEEELNKSWSQLLSIADLLHDLPSQSSTLTSGYESLAASQSLTRPLPQRESVYDTPGGVLFASDELNSFLDSLSERHLTPSVDATSPNGVAGHVSGGSESEDDVYSVMQRLTVLEGELRSEQERVRRMYAAKQRSIAADRRTLASLDTTNGRLLDELRELKGHVESIAENGKTTTLC